MWYQVLCSEDIKYFGYKSALTKKRIQHVSTDRSYRITSPRISVWAASAKSWLICPLIRTCLYDLSTLLNLYMILAATLCKTTPMVSNTPQYLPVCQFQRFLDANSSTYHQQHVQCQFASLGQLLIGLDREFISAF